MTEGAPPGSAGVPPACTSVSSRSVSLRLGTRQSAGGNGMGLAEAESCRRCRSSRVEELAEAVPGRMQAGRPRSRVCRCTTLLEKGHFREKIPSLTMTAKEAP